MQFRINLITFTGRRFLGAWLFLSHSRFFLSIFFWGGKIALIIYKYSPKARDYNGGHKTMASNEQKRSAQKLSCKDTFLWKLKLRFEHYNHNFKAKNQLAYFFRAFKSIRCYKFFFCPSSSLFPKADGRLTLLIKMNL